VRHISTFEIVSKETKARGVTMKVYKGLLVGGPDDGNSVSASSPRIKGQKLAEMWLDGEDNPSTILLEAGSYYWNEKLGCFKWHTESLDFLSNRQLQTA
jgi:hypothetical protein